MTVDFGDYHTYTTIRKCKRSDTGIYKITAKNSEGTDQADVEVCVLSVPGKPMGPIWVTDVTADSCHLEWKPPKGLFTFTVKVNKQCKQTQKM